MVCYASTGQLLKLKNMMYSIVGGRNHFAMVSCSGAERDVGDRVADWPPGTRDDA